MNKDWTGNSRANISTLASSNNCAEERQQHDFYATHPDAIDVLIKHFDLTGKSIWECAAGQGHLVHAVCSKAIHDGNEQNIIRITASDLYLHKNIYKRGEVAAEPIDFLETAKLSEEFEIDPHMSIAYKYNSDRMSSFYFNVILTNPPYKYAEQFIRHAMYLLNEEHHACFFLPIRYLASQSRKKLFEEYPPKMIIVCSKRIMCAKNGDFEALKNSSAVDYAWFVWEKGFKGDPIIKWG